MKKVLIYIGMLFSSGCYYDIAEELYPTNSISCNTSPDVYNTKIKGIIATNCAIPGCHVAINGVVPDLSDSAIVYDNIDRIQIRAINEKTMPQSGQLSSCDVNALQNWINGGTK